MLGTRPTDYDPYFDIRRFAELLVDEKESVPATAALDANRRAVAIVRAAESEVVRACRTKDNYSIQQLRDLVRNYRNGGVMGDQLLNLIAELVWSAAIRRKRFASGTPQGDDPSWKFVSERLTQLESGERIFVLEGVEETNGSGTVLGTYGEEVPEAGLLSGGQLCSSVGQPVQLWGRDTRAGRLSPGDTCNGDESNPCGC